MALKPEYQEVSERMIVRSNIGVLTNVREDHQDEMGETLPEIARSLLSTCPRNGILVTSEQNPEILEVMREVCAARGPSCSSPIPSSVSDDDINRFDYIAFKENICIALVIADLVGIPRDVAMDGMVKADPDPGVLRMKDLAIGGKRVTWANLFAVNDRESMVAAMEKLVPYITDDDDDGGDPQQSRRPGTAGDPVRRRRRVDLSFQRLVTFGAYEGLVTDRLGRTATRPSTSSTSATSTTRRRTDHPAHDHRSADRARAGGRLRQHPHPPGRGDARVLRARGPAVGVGRRDTATSTTGGGRAAAGGNAREPVPAGPRPPSISTSRSERGIEAADARLLVHDGGRALRVHVRRRRLDAPVRAPAPHDRIDRGARLHRHVHRDAVHVLATFLNVLSRTG